MRSDRSARQHPPAAGNPRPRLVHEASRRRLTGPVALVAVLALSSCGRSAPVDALGEVGTDPDIAGVSVTSPDAVVTTVQTAEGETTTSTTPLAPQQILYTVQPGDTLSGIATSYEITIQDLADYNGITDPNDISPGLELAIPPKPIEVNPAPTEESTAEESTAEDS